MQDTTSEIRLIGAMFQQLMRDLQSPVVSIRDDAYAFVEDGSLAWWDRTLGMDGVLVGQMERQLRPLPAKPRPRQLALPLAM